MPAVEPDAGLGQVVDTLALGAETQRLELPDHLEGVDVVELEDVHVAGPQACHGQVLLQRDGQEGGPTWPCNCTGATAIAKSGDFECSQLSMGIS